MEFPLRRREFCGRLSRAAALSLTSGLAACDDAGVTAPTSIPAPPPTTASGADPAPPASPAPPPVSSTVEPLPIVSAVASPDGLTVEVGPGSALAEVWSSARTQVVRVGIVRDVLLMRTGPEAFIALSGVCTHEGCIVSRVARPLFVCPCHGSRYDHTGAVVQGPAPAALPSYATVFTGGLLTVRV